MLRSQKEPLVSKDNKNHIDPSQNEYADLKQRLENLETRLYQPDLLVSYRKFQRIFKTTKMID
jgi:hypothetical protein